VVNTTPRLLYSRERYPVPSAQEVVWAPGQSGQVRKIFPPPGFGPWTVQPVASRYTDYTVWVNNATNLYQKQLKGGRANTADEPDTLQHCSGKTNNVMCQNLLHKMESNNCPSVVGLRIREISGSILDKKTGYTDMFLCSTSTFRSTQMLRQYIKLGQDRLFRIPTQLIT
jgi:hypothetical protein